MAVSGDLALTFGVQQLAPTGIAGSLGLSGNLAFVAPFTLVQTSPLDIAGAPTVTGDIATAGPFALGQAAPLGMLGTVAWLAAWHTTHRSRWRSSRRWRFPAPWACRGALLLNGAFVLSIAAPVSVQGAIGAVAVFDGLGSGDNPTDPKFQRPSHNTRIRWQRKAKQHEGGSRRPRRRRLPPPKQHLQPPQDPAAQHRGGKVAPPLPLPPCRRRHPPQGGCYGCSFSRACGSAYLQGPDAVPAPPRLAATEKPLRSLSRRCRPTSRAPSSG